jgi:translation initiation factor IF-3
LKPFRKPFFRREEAPHRINDRIRVREVLVIGPDGKSYGVLPTQDAIFKAKQYGVDLVEISPNANPPVCKIIDYGKFRYELAKKERENKKPNFAQKVKELKFHLNIDGHDYETKMRHAEQFMFKGMRVKFVLVLRGREMIHKELGLQLMQKVKAEMSQVGHPDAEPKLLGKNVSMMLSPLPAQKRVRKFTRDDDIEDEIDADDEETDSSEESKD